MRRMDIPPEIMALRNKTIQKKANTIAIQTQVLQPGIQLQRNYKPVSTADIAYPIKYTEPFIQQQIIIKGDYVSVRLVGGVGNRLFQILAALKYSETFQKTCVISRKDISNGNNPHEKNLDEIISRIFPNIKFIDNMLQPAIISETSQFKYTPMTNCITNVLLIGYFQCDQYFPSSNRIPVLKTARYTNTYFLHIRAGDYIGHPTFDQDLSTYHRNCINILRPNTKFIVFSNDNAYALNYLKQFKIDYILSDKTDQLEILIEMANCEGGICANSSFSWMGAFFQDKSVGKRFMPSVWLNGIDCSGVYPKWATVVDTRISNIPQYNLYDIVIPVGAYDYDIINKQIQYTKENIVSYRNIYIISTNEIPSIEGCIMIDENIFPFTLKTVEEAHGKNKRNGWYLQQLLKLYSGRVIPDILDRYLVIDADTFFLKPTRFMINNKCLYNYGTEYNKPYFQHMSRLHSSFKKIINNISGICHHMVFENKYIDEIFNLVESSHSMPFYQVFLNKVTEINGSGASEYELYFNYILENHSDKIVIRKLCWEDVTMLTNSNINDYESIHSYNRK